MGVALSVAGLAMQGFSMIAGGNAKASQDMANAQAEALALQHQADDSARAAEVGKIQANQIDAAYRTDLATTIANIRAIRSSTGASPDSPSSRAYIDKQSEISDMGRQIRVSGARIGSAQATADALFYRTSASQALIRGRASASADRTAGIFGAIGNTIGGLASLKF